MLCGATQNRTAGDENETFCCCMFDFVVSLRRRNGADTSVVESELDGDRHACAAAVVEFAKF